MNSVVKTKKKYELLVDVVSKYDYGDTITHQDIESIIGEHYRTAKYNSVVNQAKKHLLENHSKAIENMRGYGYRVIQPDDYVKRSLCHYKRGFNEIQKGKDILDYAPTENMSQEGRETYRAVYDRSVTLISSMAGAKVEIIGLSRKKSPFSPELVNRR